MILITGGTGFIGRALIRNLTEAGMEARVLIRPSPKSPALPRGVPMEVAVCGLSDERGLRAAMVGVDSVYHLASGEWGGTRASLLDVDIRGTQAIASMAKEAGVSRLFYISHLGADRASAYPVFKAKAIAEEHIRRSGVDYTILRSAIVFGVGDSFSTGLARILHSFPFFFAIPGDGQVLLQPLWVEDLVTCLVWAREDERTRNQVYEIGGPEALTFRQIAGEIMESSGVKRTFLPIRPPYLRGLTVVLEQLFPGLPVSVYWLDYLATNHTCALDSLPRNFNLMPSRFAQRLAYLSGQNWRMSLVQAFRRRGRP